MNKNKRLFSKRELKLIYKLHSYVGVPKLCRLFKVSGCTMHGQLKSMRLKFFKRPNDWALKKNAKMENILKIKDPHIAYSLGFLWGDGHLFKSRKRYSGARLAIVKKDFEDIEKSLAKMGKGNVYISKIGHWKEQATWILSDVRLADFLFENHYHIKSFNCPIKILSFVPKKMHGYWWRGFFDADGHLVVKDGIPKQLFFGGQFDYGWEYPLSFMSKKNIIFHATQKKSKTGNCSLFSCYRQYDMMKFLKYIYHGVEKDKIGLKRKAIKFIRLKNFIPHVKTSSHKNIMFGKIGKQPKKKWIFRVRKNGKALIFKHFDTEVEAVRCKSNYFTSLSRVSNV